MIHGENFQANFVLDTYDKEEMWYLVEEQIFHQDLIEDRYEFNYDFSGRTYGLEKLGDAILRNKRDGFSVESERMIYDFTRPVPLGYEFLSLDDAEKGRMDWGRWVARLAERDGFIQAFYHDRDYSRWQNQADIEIFELHNRPHAHLRKRICNLPEPFNNLIVAVEDNPGRYVIRPEEGFVETVTAEMWFGPEFWNRSTADRDEVLNCPFIQAEELDGGLVHILTGYRTFTEDTGPQAELQDKMRRLLFPNTVDKPLDF